MNERNGETDKSKAVNALHACLQSHQQTNRLQSNNSLIPYFGLYVPGGHAKGITDPAVQYEPVGHVLFAA